MESLEEKLKRLEIALNNLKGVFLDKLKSTDNEDSIYNTNVKIVSHLDADGLSAAAILALTLKKENIGFSVSIVKQLQKSNIQSITADVKKNNQIVIFTDLGSGQQHVIEKFINPTEYIILDHHKPEQIDDDDKIHKINHVNSHF